MGLACGTKLGPYEITAQLGAGGMGEVYRARDTRLERSVAVKILPAHLAEIPEAGERFEREARAISSLNHPNICQLHDVGVQGDVRYIVMELLEGETLAERLRRGPLPLNQVLRFGAQIADGLDAAHRRGVVHRDLKPGNIMLTTSAAKLMDFGLAKDMAPSKPASAELTATLTSSHPTPLTAQGTIVGTFHYMSPEQVEGKEADARSDIFSLGAVLYEMVSGKRAFEGKTAVAVAAEILQKDPLPIETLQPTTPPPLERVVKKCLAKDPDDRWQSAGDLASELRWIAEGRVTASGTHLAAQPVSRRGFRISEFLAWMFAAMAVIAVVVLGIILGVSANNKPVVRTQIAPSEKLQFSFVGDSGGPPVISPDGTQVVFSARAEGKTQLFHRSMDQLNAVPLPGTEEATFPFWSPDGRSIAFFAGGKLKRMDIGGGPVIICDGLIARGGAWSPKGVIVFSPNAQQPLVKVSANGGTPTPLTQLGEKYTTHRWPSFMPDGEHFIYLAANHNAPSGADTGIFWASLDGKHNKFLLHTLSNAIYAAGYLLFVRENALMAQRFNPSSGEFQGEAMVLNDDVQVDASVWRGTFTASDNGTLIYQPGAAGAAMRLTWIDNSGKEIGDPSSPDAYVEVQISHDDKKAAVVIEDQLGVIWIYDLVHNTRTRFSFGNGAYGSPLWSHDGKQIAFTGPVPGGKGEAVMVKVADGSGEEKELMAIDSGQQAVLQQLWDWSPDGRYILYGVGNFGVGNGQDIWVLPLFGDRTPFPYAAGPGEQVYAQFSPDGRWVAYVSNETGQQEVYVAPFPWTGAKWQVSQSGGWVPRWTRGGTEIIFQSAGSPKTWAAQVDGHGSSFEVEQVRLLFETNNLAPNTSAAQYAVTSDGQRLLEITTGDAGRPPLTVIQNWTAELKKK